MSEPRVLEAWEIAEVVQLFKIESHTKYVEWSDYEHMKKAFDAAKAYIDETPCDPDIYPEQLKAWRAYQDALVKVAK